MTRRPGALVAVALRLALATTAYVQLGTRLAAAQSDEHSRIAVKAPVDSLLERLVGQWTMRGSIRGRAAMYHVSAQRTLGGRYVEIHMRDTSSKAPYEARVFIGADTLPGAVIVHWLDNTGAAFSVPAGRGSVAGDTLRFQFEYSTGPFRDRFVYRRQAREWDVRLESGDGKGGWRLFAEYVMAAAPK
jgi:hypothetical protein